MATEKKEGFNLSIQAQDWIIFLGFMIFVTGSVYFKPGLPVIVDREVMNFYDEMESIPDGSVILWVHGNSILSKFTTVPTDEVVTKHLFDLMRQRDIKLVITVNGALGLPMMDETLNKLDTGGLTYGEDYAFLGWLPGGEAVYAGLASDIWVTAPVDRYGTPIEDLPMMQDIRSSDDVTHYIITTEGSIDDHMRQWHGKVDRILLVADIVCIPIARSYIDADMVNAYISQLVPTAAYEKLVNYPGLGTAFVDGNSVGVIYAILLVVVTNLIHLFRRREL